MIYQNLAFCRYLHIIFLCYLSNLLNFSPLILILFTLIIHLINLSNKYMTKSKKYGLVFFDIILISIDLFKRNRNNDFKLYLTEVSYTFFIYNIILFVFGLIRNDNLNIIELHYNKLKEDDIYHTNESYLEYFKRVWCYFVYY